MAQVFDPSSGRWVEVPDDQVTALVATGKAYLPKGKVPVVDARGVAGEVPAEDAPQAFSSGFRYRTATEIQAEQQREQFEDRPVAAGVAGAARGATLGLSDVFLTEIGAVRPETLRGLEDYNPEASVGGEVLGVGATVLASGGSAAPAAVAERAGTRLGVAAAERLGGGAITRGAAKGAFEGGLAGLGRAVTDAAQERDPLTAEKALASTATGALFGLGAGAIFGAAEQRLTRAPPVPGASAADDLPPTSLAAATDDVPLGTATDVPAGPTTPPGPGAPAGPPPPPEAPPTSAGGAPPPPGGPFSAEGLAEGALNLAKPVKEAIEKNPGVFRRTAEALELGFPDADEWVLRGLDAKKKQLERLDMKGLLTSAPRALRSDPRFKGVRNGLEAARLVRTKVEESGNQVRSAAAQLDELVQPADQFDVASFASRAEAEIVAPLAKGTVDERRAAARIQEELEALRSSSRIGRNLTTGDVLYGKMSFADAEDFKRRLTESINYDATTPNMIRTQLKNLRGLVNRTQEEIADRVSKKTGSEVFSEWKRAKTLFGQMAELDKIAKDRLEAAKTANRFFSLTDNLAGLAGVVAGGGLNPVGLGVALGAALLNKWGRENLPFVMARAMADYDSNPGARQAARALVSRLRGGPDAGAPPAGGTPPTTPGAPGGAAVQGALLGMVQRAAQQGPREAWVAHNVLSGSEEYREAMEREGLAQYASEADAEGQRRAGAVSRVEEAAADFDRRADAATKGILSGRRSVPRPVSTPDALAKADEVRQAADDPEGTVQRVAERVADLGADAPGLAGEMQAGAQRAITFLASKAPARPRSPLGDIPALRAPWTPSEAEVSRWSAYLRAVEDPTSVLDEAASGRLAPEAVEALAAVYPALLEDLRSRVIEQLASHPRRLDYQQRVSLGVLLGMELDASMSPQVVASVQTMHQQQPEKPQARPSTTPTTTQKRLESEFSPSDGLTERSV